MQSKATESSLARIVSWLTGGADEAEELTSWHVGFD